MARVSVTTQPVTRTGTATVLTGPTVDGDIIDTGRTMLYVLNGSGAPITVTVQTPLTVDGLDVADLTVTVPAAGFRIIGPFPVGTFGRAYGDANAGRAYVDYSSVTSVTRGVISV